MPKLPNIILLSEAHNVYIMRAPCIILKAVYFILKAVHVILKVHGPNHLKVHVVHNGT